MLSSAIPLCPVHSNSVLTELICAAEGTKTDSVTLLGISGPKSQGRKKKRRDGTRNTKYRDNTEEQDERREPCACG